VSNLNLKLQNLLCQEKIDYNELEKNVKILNKIFLNKNINCYSKYDNL
jgi:hypothetical protein